MSDPIEEARAKIHELPPRGEPAGEQADAEGEGRAEANERKSLATRIVRELLELEQAGEVDFFSNKRGEPYALVKGADSEGWRVLRVDKRPFELFLISRHYKEYEGCLPSRALQEVVGTIEARALSTDRVRETFVRLGQAGGTIYLDLADSAGTIVEITAGGWKRLEGGKPPVMFLRPRTTHALPMPERGGKLAEFGDLFPHVLGRDMSLILAFIIGLFRPEGPYPVLELAGEQGSGKSTIAECIGLLVDPGSPQLRAQPASGRDLALAARNRRLLIFDNVSNIEPAMSDAYCRITGGGGLATRKNYSDDEETTFDEQRPLIFNGINRSATRGDLVDRIMSAEIPPLYDGDRRDRAGIMQRFSEMRPRLLGAVLAAAAAGHAARGDPPPGLWRDPGYVRFVLAGADAAGMDRSEVEHALEDSRSEGASGVVDGSPLGRALREFSSDPNNCDRGYRPADLYAALTRSVRGEDGGKPLPPRWPPNEDTMSKQLKRLAPDLRKEGIDITPTPRSRAGRGIWIKRLKETH